MTPSLTMVVINDAGKEVRQHRAHVLGADHHRDTRLSVSGVKRGSAQAPVRVRGHREGPACLRVWRPGRTGGARRAASGCHYTRKRG